MKRILIFLVGISMVFFLLSFNTTLAAEKQIVLKLAHITAGGGIIDKEAQKFAELLAQKTNGRV